MVHPHAPQHLTQAQRDANTIENLNVLVEGLQARVIAQANRIADLELLVNADVRILAEENRRLRSYLRELRRD